MSGPGTPRRLQRGVAALELALLLLFCGFLLSVPVYVAQALWHYTVMQRAALDAAAYLSRIPLSEIRNTSAVQRVTAVANQIVQAEMAELTLADTPFVRWSCDNIVGCGTSYRTEPAAPATVQVTINAAMEGIGPSGIYYFELATDVTLAYVGN